MTLLLHPWSLDPPCKAQEALDVTHPLTHVWRGTAALEKHRNAYHPGLVRRLDFREHSKEKLAFPVKLECE